MKYILFAFFISLNIFSQEIIVPVESKTEYLYNNPNYRNYIFKDINNVFEKFLGKWKYETGDCDINIEIFKFYDKDNHQDAIYVNVKYIKGSQLVMDTSKFETQGYIYGGTFENKNSINAVIVYFSEISETWNCGHVSRVKLICENANSLTWKIDKDELLFNKTASLFPREIQFTKQ